MKKGRTVKKDKYETKTYLKGVPLKDVKKILKAPHVQTIRKLQQRDKETEYVHCVRRMKATPKAKKIAMKELIL